MLCKRNTCFSQASSLCHRGSRSQSLVRHDLRCQYRRGHHRHLSIKHRWRRDKCYGPAKHTWTSDCFLLGSWRYDKVTWMSQLFDISTISFPDKFEIDPEHLLYSFSTFFESSQFMYNQLYLFVKACKLFCPL